MPRALSIEQKIEWAQKASLVGLESLDDFCLEEGLPLGEVSSWSTAYEIGGRLGVQAMVVQWKPKARVSREWHESIKLAVRAFRPRRLRVVADGNRYAVEEVKPLTAKSIVYTPLFQLRIVEDKKGAEHWFLYWRRADGTWWPYAGTASFKTIDAAVQEVITDPYRCFRLHPLH